MVKENIRTDVYCRKDKKVSTTLNYIEHFFILASTVTGFISISTFPFLLGIPIGIASSAIGLKNCATELKKELKSISQ